MRAVALAGVLVALARGPAAAQVGEAEGGAGDAGAILDEDPDTTGFSRADASGDPTFGPVVIIEKIEISGNSSTATRVIERVLPFAEGDAMRTGDPRLNEARIKVLALGYFRTVETRLRRGTQRGRVVFSVVVEERGTLVLNRMHFGTSLYTPWWAGLELTERNLLGTGLAVGGGFVFTGEGRPEGATRQKAFQLQLADPSVLGTRLGVHGAALYVDASEPYRIAGDPSSDRAENFAAFDYRRAGGRAGASWDATPLTRFNFTGRIERVDAGLPPAPTRELPDGTVTAVDLRLRPGRSRVVTLALGYDRDTRSDPILTVSGDRLLLHGELGASFLGGDYDYGVGLARYQRWWPMRSVDHVLSMHLTGGLVLGEAPRFDRLHVGDLNRLVSPRSLGLVVSTTPSHDLLGTATDDVTYGEIGGVAEVQYSYRLFRTQRHVYGGDLFVGAGLWALARTRDLRVRDTTLYRALPVDLLIDVGLRLDTEIGIFELSLANALGRVPL